MSTPTCPDRPASYVIRHTEARLIATYGDDVVRLPSTATAYRILDELDRLHPLFSNSTKRNRDIAARPVSALRQDASRRGPVSTC